MSKFVSIYLQVIRRQSLKDEIPVTELPQLVQQDLSRQAEQMATIQRLKQKDSAAAKLRLEALRKQLEAKNT